MEEHLKYSTFDAYDGQNTQLDGQLTDSTGTTQLDIWSTDEAEDLPAGAATEAQRIWEAGQVMVQEFGATPSLIVPEAPLSLRGIEDAIRRFRPDAASIDLSDLSSQI